VLKRILTIALVVAIVAIPINDIGRYLSSYYNLDNISRDVAFQAASQARRVTGRDALAAYAAQYALERGVTVKYFDMTIDKIDVTTTMAVPGTWVWGPVVAASKGLPWSQWWNTPLVIEAKAESLRN
jgi:hypothetical protein